MSVPNTLEAKIRANRLLHLPVDWRDEMIFPAFDGLSILNASATLGAALGVDAGMPLDSAVWQGESPLEKVDRVVLIISDGLGYLWLKRLIAEDPMIAGLVADLSGGRPPVPLTSIAPSTTAVALPTLYSASAPATHGMLGTLMNLYPLHTIVDMLSMSSVIGGQMGNITQWGINPTQLIEGQMLPEKLGAAGVPVHLVIERALMGSGISTVLHRGISDFHGFIKFSDWAMRLRAALKQTAGKRALVVTYWDGVDSLSHTYGAKSDEVRHEIRTQLTLLRDALARPEGRDGRTLVMLLADHGHHDAPTDIDLSQTPAGQHILDAMRGTFTGDQRFAYLHLRDGQTPSVVDALKATYSESLVWFTPSEGLAAGVFGRGEVHRHFAHRAGDLIVTPRLGSKLAYPLQPSDPRRIHTPISVHAGLSDWEMLVPMLWHTL